MLVAQNDVSIIPYATRGFYHRSTGLGNVEVASIRAEEQSGNDRSVVRYERTWSAPHSSSILKSGRNPPVRPHTDDYGLVVRKTFFLPGWGLPGRRLSRAAEENWRESRLFEANATLIGRSLQRVIRNVIATSLVCKFEGLKEAFLVAAH